MNAHDLIQEIIERKGKIENVFWIACGGSMIDLMPANELLKREATTFTSTVYTAREFCLMAPKSLGPKSLVIACSHSGNTQCMHVLRRNKAGDYEPLDELYTKRKNGEAQFLGLPALTKDFAIYITDRWNNSSDTLTATLTPIFEMQIPYTDIKPYNMTGDTPSEHGWLVDYLWDDRLFDGANSGYHTEVFSGPWPHRITFRVMTGKVKRDKVLANHAK